jgi:S-DNA-T family DNA segregation ATPase FtsK/SpoIIIE
VVGILLLGSSLVFLLGLSTYRPHQPAANWAGPLGHGLAAALLGVTGVGAYAAVLFLALVAVSLLAGHPKFNFSRTLSWVVACGAAMALLGLFLRVRVQGHLPGGLAGALVAGALRGAFSTVGAAVLLSAIGLAALTVATDLWALRAAAAAGKLGLAGGAMVLKGAAAAVGAARGSRDEEAAEADESGAFAERAEDDPAYADEPSWEGPGREPKKATDEGRAKAAALALASAGEPPEDPREPVGPRISDPPRGRKRKDGQPTPKPEAKLERSAAEAGALAAQDEASAEALSLGAAARTDPAAPAPTIVEPRPLAASPQAGRAEGESKARTAKDKAAAEVDRQAAKPAKEFTLFGGREGFTAPPIDILTGEASAAGPLDREGLTATAERLRVKLASFGIQGQVTQIRPGPVVTMFEFLPAAGVKVSRIASLSDDLAMAMEALRVRIVAPIPGKGVVGIEVPNKQRQTVVLKELVEQEAFQKSPSKLAMCLGKDIEGLPYIADLAKMPHLLIAGTTGSGKSVAVNAMIVSMLLRASPEEVRFLMVDPKMLELSVYEGIPHLLLPVVTDSKKAAMALRWAVEEMERRYQLLAECGVRNIGSYNKKVEKEGDGARKPQKAMGKEKRVVDLTDPTLDVHELQRLAASGELTAVREQIGLRPSAPGDAGERVGAGALKSSFLSEGPGAVHGGVEATRGAAANGAGALAPSGAEWLLAEMQARGEKVDVPGKQEELQLEPLRKLPYLVIIIDELADLMMVASREVETYIARLAQMARAAGIHLMVATQRPSTDVVTGVIKANFPARISFQVASRHDSATIINTPGAENLLGMGDMLILPPGTSSLTRVHGPYVDEKEIHAVVEHWKSQGAPVYDPSILKPRAEDGEGLDGVADEGPDELYDQAIAAVGDMRFISISLLQRKLRVGYNRAARMIERMERDGIVGPADGAKPREVLIRPVGDMPGAGS